jgi:hypothetical protein
MPPKRSKLQRNHAHSSVAAINARKNAKNASDEPSAPRSPLITISASKLNILQQEITAKTAKLTEIRRILRNKTKEAIRAKKRSTILSNDLRKLKHLNHMQHARIPGQKERAAQKAGKSRTSVSLKKEGIVTDEAREMIRDLSIEGRVPDSKINLVIKTVGRWLGMEIHDKISERTVGRVVEEGGLATKAQLVQEIEDERGEQSAPHLIQLAYVC